jgi:tetratricopeptide (TPR) repeat protein
VRKALALALAAAVCCAFLPALRNGFVWDDNQYVLKNPHVLAGPTAADLRWALTAFEQGNWHPLTWFSHQLDVRLFGLRPRGHHAVNILLHAANALLLFGLLERLTGARWRSLLVAALFALHPLRVESVAWVAERKDLLSSLFALLAAGAHARFARRPGRARAAATVLLFAAALASKAMVVTLPFVLLLLDFWPLGRLTRASWRRPLLEKLPLFALSAAASAVAYLAQSRAGYTSDYPVAARLGNAVVGYLRYLGRTFLPTDLAAFYPHAMRALPLWQTLGSLLALAAATFLVIRHLRSRPYLATGWLWYLGTLVPVIGLVQVGQQAIADRYTYLPGVGVALALVWAGGDLARARPFLRLPLAGAAAAALLALAAATFVQVGYWKDPVSLYTRAIEAVPGNWLAHYNLGVHYRNAGRDDLAEEHYRASLRYRGDYAFALNNLGMILAERGETAQAVALYEAAIRSLPGYDDPYNNLGAAFVRLARPREAETCYRAALRLSPASAEARHNLAVLLLDQGRWAEAAAELDEALRLDPGAGWAHKGLGVILARRGRYPEAAAQLREAVRLDPGDRESRANLEAILPLLR